jgi:hypothetical protein
VGYVYMRIPCFAFGTETAHKRVESIMLPVQYSLVSRSKVVNGSNVVPVAIQLTRAA